MLEGPKCNHRAELRYAESLKCGAETVFVFGVGSKSADEGWHPLCYHNRLSHPTTGFRGF